MHTRPFALPGLIAVGNIKVRALFTQCDHCGDRSRDRSPVITMIIVNTCDRCSNWSTWASCGHNVNIY